jgi:hypothetical protein
MLKLRTGVRQITIEHDLEGELIVVVRRTDGSIGEILNVRHASRNQVKNIILDHLVKED